MLVWREHAMLGKAAIHTAVLQAALDAVVVMDEDGKVVEMNGAAEQMFGYGAAESAGRLLADLIIPAQRRCAPARAAPSR
jgi:PAS domain S-box-containing protein